MLGQHQEPAVGSNRQPGRLMVLARPNRLADRQPARVQGDHRRSLRQVAQIEHGLAVDQDVVDQPGRILGGSHGLGRRGGGRVGPGPGGVHEPLELRFVHGHVTHVAERPLLDHVLRDVNPAEPQGGISACPRPDLLRPARLPGQPIPAATVTSIKIQPDRNTGLTTEGGLTTEVRRSRSRDWEQ